MIEKLIPINDQIENIKLNKEKSDQSANSTKLIMNDKIT